MIKYSIPTLLFFISIIVLSCNTQVNNDKEGTVHTLAAIPSSVAAITTDTLIDFTYETVVLEADLPSPRKEMSGRIGDINIKVNYGSPSVKGRDLWGALVPFGKIWRTGANEATTFTVDQAIELNGQKIAAGTYGLFTLPTKDSWQLILNKTAEQWGAYEYDEKEDVLRVDIIPQPTELLSEMVEFVIEGNKLVLLWGNLKVPVLVKG